MPDLFRQPGSRFLLKDWPAIVLLALFSIFSLPVSATPEFRSEKLVTVQPGETLYEIVKREMRSPEHWPAIARHNNIQNPATIRQGQVIRIPLIYTRSKESAVVIFVKGTASRRLVDTGDDAKISRGDAVNVGDQIRTGHDGFVSVEFRSGSVINVQPDSHISIVDIDCEDNASDCIIEIYAEKGGVQSRVNARENQPVQFRINTPSGSAAVRGTIFDIDTGMEQSATGVTSGQVDMIAEGETVEVDRGFGVISEAGNPPGAPTPLLLPPVFTQVPKRLVKGEALQWWADPDAAAYQLQFSEDESASKVVSSALVEEPSYALMDEPRGDYYLTLRSVDELGLKGLPSMTPVQLVSTRANAATPGLDGALYGASAAFTLASGVKGASGYEIQVSADPDFMSFLGVDVAVGQGADVAIEPGATLWARSRAVFEDYRVGPYSEVVEVSRP
ncbi:MAG: FecR domain-containing protein [Gammaproteobacteria bacterium]|nr:FecR domain-containing protein [Gammaproteobacteria bacterium]